MFTSITGVRRVSARKGKRSAKKKRMVEIPDLLSDQENGEPQTSTAGQAQPSDEIKRKFIGKHIYLCYAITYPDALKLTHIARAPY